jgi:hypothetical protein
MVAALLTTGCDGRATDGALAELEWPPPESSPGFPPRPARHAAMLGYLDVDTCSKQVSRHDQQVAHEQAEWARRRKDLKPLDVPRFLARGMLRLSVAMR